ncbi:hypothetical protein [Prescottella subtropica]|uniref:hypothetical protein n=1 Tax=Prescottella subtropica TaxID=2545757 RepID=UPI0010F5EB0E|nr:hypothetical protein [Prescottella subtropica]
MSVVATPSAHTLIRDLVANSERRHFLDDPEGIEMSNQAALMREVVVTVQACLASDLDATRAAERQARSADLFWSDGPGLRLTAAIAQYDEILATLLDASGMLENGRTTTTWTLLGSAADRLRILLDLESPSGPETARRVALASAHARDRLTAAASDDYLDLGLPDAFVPSDVVAAEQVPLSLPRPAAELDEAATLIDLVALGAATCRDGGPLGVLSLHGPDAAGYDHLATIGGYQFHLVLDIVRTATDSLCATAGLLTGEDVWAGWSDDVRAAVEFAWDCI